MLSRNEIKIAKIDTSQATQLLASKIASSLANTSSPAISAYHLAKLFWQSADHSTADQNKAAYEDVINNLTSSKLLTPLAGVKPISYSIFGRQKASPAEVICSLDPFAYVSHLSAMNYHGLTDRFPQLIYLSRPSLSEWRKAACAMMQRDFGDQLPTFVKAKLPRLIPLQTEKIQDTSVRFYERSHLGAFKRIEGNSVRVATIGRVFLDMLREPSLCGGIQHVIDIYRREAKRFLRLIVDEINRHGKPIDKVRAGYIISELCQLNPPEIADWEKLAQRGGSRKLDPDNEFASHYSARWMLSLNVVSLKDSD
jgi:predicted transcriptional regulator of viral defense system